MTHYVIFFKIVYAIIIYAVNFFVGNKMICWLNRISRKYIFATHLNRKIQSLEN